MNYKEAVVMWEPGGEVTVCSRQEAMIRGYLSRWLVYHVFSENDAKTVILADALILITRDGCDPKDVHREFMKVDVYEYAVCVD